MDPRKPSPSSMTGRMDSSTAQNWRSPVVTPVRPSGGTSSAAAGGGVLLPKITPPTSSSSRTNSPRGGVHKRMVWMFPRGAAEVLPAAKQPRALISAVSGNVDQLGDGDEVVHFCNDGIPVPFFPTQSDGASQLSFMDEMYKLKAELDEEQANEETRSIAIQHQVETQERATFDAIQRYGSHVMEESENFGTIGKCVALGSSRESSVTTMNQKFRPHQPRSTSPPNPTAMLGKSQLELCSVLGKNAELRMRSREIERQADQVSSELEHTQREMKMAERRIAKREEKLRVLLKEKLYWQNEINDLREQVVEEKMRQVDLMRRLEATKRETNTQLDSMDRLVRDSEEDNHALRTYLVETKNQLLAQTRRLEDSVKQARDEKERLTDCIMEARNKFREWRESEAAALKSQKDQAVNYIKAEYELKIARHQEEKQKLRDKVKDLEVSIRLMQKDRSLSPLELSLRKATILGGKDNAGTTEAELIEANVRIKELEGLLEHSQEFQKQQENIIKVSEATISRLLQEREEAALDNLAHQRMSGNSVWFGSTSNEVLSSPTTFSSNASLSPRQLAVPVRTQRNDISRNPISESRSLRLDPSPPPTEDHPLRPSAPPPRCSELLSPSNKLSSERKIVKDSDVSRPDMVSSSFLHQRSLREEYLVEQVKVMQETLTEPTIAQSTDVRRLGRARPKDRIDYEDIDGGSPHNSQEGSAETEVKALDHIHQVESSQVDLDMRCESVQIDDVGLDGDTSILLAKSDPCPERSTFTPDSTTLMSAERNIGDVFDWSEVDARASEMTDNNIDSLDKGDPSTSDHNALSSQIDKRDEGDEATYDRITELADADQINIARLVWDEIVADESPSLNTRKLFANSGESELSITPFHHYEDRSTDGSDPPTQIEDDHGGEKVNFANFQERAQFWPDSHLARNDDIGEPRSSRLGDIRQVECTHWENPDNEFTLCQDSRDGIVKASDARGDLSLNAVRQIVESIVSSVQHQALLALSNESSLCNPVEAKVENSSLMIMTATLMASQLVKCVMEVALLASTAYRSAQVCVETDNSAKSETTREASCLGNNTVEEAGEAVASCPSYPGTGHHFSSGTTCEMLTSVDDDFPELSQLKVGTKVIEGEPCATEQMDLDDIRVFRPCRKECAFNNAESWSSLCEDEHSELAAHAVPEPILLPFIIVRDCVREETNVRCVGYGDAHYFNEMTDTLDMTSETCTEKTKLLKHPTYGTRDVETITARAVHILAASVTIASSARGVAMVSALSVLTSMGRAKHVADDHSIVENAEDSLDALTTGIQYDATNCIKEQQDGMDYDSSEMENAFSPVVAFGNDLTVPHAFAPSALTTSIDDVQFVHSNAHRFKLHKNLNDGVLVDFCALEDGHVLTTQYDRTHPTKDNAHLNASRNLDQHPPCGVEGVLQALVNAVSVVEEEATSSLEAEVEFAKLEIDESTSGSPVNGHESSLTNGIALGEEHAHSTATLDHYMTLSSAIDVLELLNEVNTTKPSIYRGEAGQQRVAEEEYSSFSSRNPPDNLPVCSWPLSAHAADDRGALIYEVATVHVSDLIDRCITNRTHRIFNEDHHTIEQCDEQEASLSHIINESDSGGKINLMDEASVDVRAKKSCVVDGNHDDSDVVARLGAGSSGSACIDETIESIALYELSDSACREVTKCVDNVIQSLTVVVDHSRVEDSKTARSLEVADDYCLSCPPEGLSAIPPVVEELDTLDSLSTDIYAQTCVQAIIDAVIAANDIIPTTAHSDGLITVSEGEIAEETSDVSLANTNAKAIARIVDGVKYASALTNTLVSDDNAASQVADPQLCDVGDNPRVEYRRADNTFTDIGSKGPSSNVGSCDTADLTRCSTMVSKERAESWHELLNPTPFVDPPRLSAERSSIPVMKSPAMAFSDPSRYASAVVREMIRDPTLMAYDVKHEQNQPFALLDEKILMIDQNARHMQHDENDKARVSVIAEVPSSRHTAAIEGVLVTKRKKMENEAHRKSIAYRIIPAFNYEPVLIKFQWSDFVVATPIRLMSSGSQLNLLTSLSNSVVSDAGARSGTETSAIKDHANRTQILTSPIQKMKLLAKKGVKLPCGAYVIISVFNRPLEDGNENLRIQIYDSERVEEFQYDFHEDHLRDYVEDWKGADDEARAFFSRLEFRREQGSIIIKMPEKIRKSLPPAPDSEVERESIDPKVCTPTPMAQLLTSLATTQPLELPPEPHYRLSPNAPMSPQRQPPVEQLQSFSSIPRIEEDSESGVSSMLEK